MGTVYVRFDIEPMSAAEGYAVCEFVDGLPTRQVTVVGDRLVSSLDAEEDPEFGPTLTESALDEDWRTEEPELTEVGAGEFEELWERATAR
ncbi:hypothetical protein SAMN05192558_111207 [Actinokineospora alba]|uniref:Uncharacterized protein n=1 Tax=Actinokineospora alba TaxID=504798 RepID=A0A1H0UI65_9PSEU|nr:hypothetical protein [Actinokineospora alba]TDP65072.1 hypothetical protein C8E96_0551 [Actinokineospora alba]SDH53435.1 hypothetical protein SAMN05421871_101374 [Actinokineospora alba]SDP65760.1 hypothetical protein SAMN05192558_111207 [Actinokineospora alba]